MTSVHTALISVWKGEMGIRSISSHLKENGFSVDLLFCPQYGDRLYSSSQLESIVSKLHERNPDVVGLSCSTEMSKRRVVQLVKELRVLDYSPFIVLGGNAATFTPEEALKYVDGICIGEGEKAVLELVKKLQDDREIYFIPSIRVSENRTVSGLWKEVDLNTIPTIDYGFSGGESGKYFRLVGENLVYVLCHYRLYSERPHCSHNPQPT